MIHTFTINNVVIDKSYILKALEERGIFEVDGVKPQKGRAPKVNVEEWLSKTHGKGKESEQAFERNYIYLLFYLTIIIAMTFSYREESKWWFKNISSETLESYISNKHGLLTIIRNILKSAEILKFNDSYEVGGHTKSVSLHTRFKNERASYRSLANIDASFIPTRKWVKEVIEPIEDDVSTTSIITDNLSKLRLSKKAFAQLKSGTFKSKRSEDTTRRLIDEFYSFAGLDLQDADRLKENIYFKYKPHTGRVYSPITGFPRDFRKHLSYKGAALSIVDIRAAHPWILLYWYKKSKAHPKMIEREQDKYRSWFTDRKDFPSFYGRIAQAAKVDKPDAVLKKEFFAFLYGKVRDPKSCYITQVYDDEFPILLETINWHKKNIYTKQQTPIYSYLESELKKENAKRKKKDKPLQSLLDFAHKQSNLENSKIEGDVMILGVCVELAEEGIWHVPIHDAIVCQKRRVRDVKRVMKEHWLERVGFEPHLSETHYKKDL